MIKPALMHSWEQVQTIFEIPENLKPSIANRNAILSRMFPDAHCEFDDTDFFARSMWSSFFAQREEHAHLNDSNDESEDEPQPKKSKAESLKGKSSAIDSDEDSPPREPEPPAKLQSWKWDEFLHQRMPRRDHPDPSRNDKMWRCGDPPAP